MMEAINSLIVELQTRFADTRTNLFDVKAESTNDSKTKFTGRVLEQDNLNDLKQSFQVKFPSLQPDYSGVEVLRKPKPTILNVATNLTSLHAEPSWLAEQLSQLLFGWKLEILFEKGSWCFVRQEDGYLGWAYKPYLTADPILPITHLVTAAVLPLYDLPERTSALVTRLMVSSGVHVLQVKGAWAEVQANERGWVHLADLRAVTDFPSTEEQRRRQMVEDAFRMTGVQYLWGGGSGHGIDCSGLAQV
ncbi:MAG: C40 family peptidase, partial [Anaerolineaceae bacterium]|nr:C40 family peptidase [Anaerolineaceae bacterium]